jgi:hypothetical protein
MSPTPHSRSVTCSNTAFEELRTAPGNEDLSAATDTAERLREALKRFQG